MAVKYGLAAGAITVLVFTLAYLINFDIYLSSIFYWSTTSIYLVAMYMLAAKVTDNGGETFREIVRPLFICYLVANLVFFVFNYIMITYVDTTIYPEQCLRMVSKMKQLELEDTDMTFKLSNYVLQYFQSAIGGFIISASIAFSKKQS